MLSCMSSLYILNINPLSDVLFANIFSHSVGIFFYLVDDFLCWAKAFQVDVTHLEPDILEYEVKWALGSITTNKASGGDGIPVELFQILKDDAVKVLHSMCQQIWKTQQWPQDWKRSVFIPIPKKGNAKE